jgi:hypothetical protein
MRHVAGQLRGACDVRIEEAAQTRKGLCLSWPLEGLS